MWFQDLWTYDFRRTEMCVIPYATQEGEISFCAYNTGVGWRQIVENMHMVATTSEWFKQKGRHTIYAGRPAHPLAGRAQAAAAGGLGGDGERQGRRQRPAAAAGAGAAAAVTDAGGVSAPRSRSHGTLVPLMRGGGRLYSRSSRFQEVREMP